MKSNCMKFSSKKISNSNLFTEISLLLIALSFVALAVAQKHGERTDKCKRPFPDNKAPLFPHPEDCTKYFECHYEGYYYEKQCVGPETSKFDPIANYCVHKLTEDEC